MASYHPIAAPISAEWMIVMALQIKQVSNPLTLIAVFASLAEVAATAALPTLDGTVQAQFVWFVMLFPVLLVVLFFVTLNWNHRVLYAPSDYTDETNFLRALFGDENVGDVKIEGYGSEADEQAKLRQFWKPGGLVNSANEKILQDWLTANALSGLPITSFLYGANYASARQQAVGALNL
jgi:hypothetical protein